MTFAVNDRYNAGCDRAITCRKVRILTMDMLPLWNRPIMRWTSAARPVRYEPIGYGAGQVYVPEFAPRMSAIRRERGTRPTTMEISGSIAPIDDPAVGLTVEDFAVGRLRDARVVHAWVDASRPWVVSPFVDTFYVEGSTFDDVRYEIQLAGIMARINTPRGEIGRRDCANHLGDAVCQVPLDGASPFEQFRIADASANVLAGDNRREVTLDFTGHPKSSRFVTDWFAFGDLVGTNGRNANITRKIVSSTSGQSPIFGSTHRIHVVLSEAFPFSIQSGHQFDLVAGCDKRYSTCGSKFPIEAVVGNRRQFRGQPFLIGTDRLIRSGDAT